MGRVLSLPGLAGIAVLFAALSTYVVARRADTIEVDPNASAELKGVQLRVAKRVALQGDAAATRRVVEHYVLVDGNRSLIDTWSRVAAIQGDQAEMLNHANHIAKFGTEDACAEALAWINKVIAAPTSPYHKQKADRLRAQLTGKDMAVPCALWYQRKLR